MSTETARGTAGSPSSPYPPAGIAWYSTVLLALLYWLSILDRTVISLLVDPIKADLGISDVQFGMLHGLAFAVTFSLFGLAAGTLADRFSRRVIIFFSVAAWSLATAACGLAKDFWHLLAARVGVGAGEAGLNPCATSMITDLFPPARLTMALAIYSLGASAGSGCAYLFGGILVELVSGADEMALPLIGAVKPWQAVFLIIGIPGVLLALLAFSMPEPARRGTQAGGQAGPAMRDLFSGYPELLKFIRSRGRFFFSHYAGFGLASTGFVGAAAWYPAHMSREFAWSGSEIGVAWLDGVIGATTVQFIRVDTFARWRIQDPLAFFKAVTDERGGQSRLDDIIDGKTRDAIASYDLIEVVRASGRAFEMSEELLSLDLMDRVEAEISMGRERIGEQVLQASAAITPQFGVELVDVRFKRINYVEQVQQSVFQRMISERNRIAERSRSEGRGRSAEVRGRKERDLQRIQSEAYRTSEEIKGKADAEASAIYARAYGRDADFYRFWKNLETFRKTLDPNTTMVLSTDSEWLRYLENAQGR